MAALEPLTPTLLRLRLFALASFYSLIGFFLVLSLLALDSIRLSSAIIWLLQVAPLLPFAWGLHKGIARVYMWLSLVTLLYFMHGVLVAFNPQRQIQGSVEILLCTLLFIALVAYVRAARPAKEKS